MCSREGLLDLKNEKYVVSIFYLGRAQLLSRSGYFGVSVHREQAPAAQPEAHLSPASEGHGNWKCHSFISLIWGL